MSQEGGSSESNINIKSTSSNLSEPCSSLQSNAKRWLVGNLSDIVAKPFWRGTSVFACFSLYFVKAFFYEHVLKLRRLFGMKILYML